MYYPKLTYASSTIEGIFILAILCLSKTIFGSCKWKKEIKATGKHPYGLRHPLLYLYGFKDALTKQSKQSKLIIHYIRFMKSFIGVDYIFYRRYHSN